MEYGMLRAARFYRCSRPSCITLGSD